VCVCVCVCVCVGLWVCVAVCVCVCVCVCVSVCLLYLRVLFCVGELVAVADTYQGPQITTAVAAMSPGDFNVFGASIDLARLLRLAPAAAGASLLALIAGTRRVRGCVSVDASMCVLVCFCACVYVRTRTFVGSRLCVYHVGGASRLRDVDQRARARLAEGVCRAGLGVEAHQVCVCVWVLCVCVCVFSCVYMRVCVCG
jgi:hypothetical protein